MQDQLGLRVSSNYVKGDGQIKNAYASGLDPNSQDRLQLRAIPFASFAKIVTINLIGTFNVL